MPTKPPTVELLSWNTTNRSIRVAINGTRYDYFFHPDKNITALVRAVSQQLRIPAPGKAIIWLRRQSERYERVSV